MSKISLPRGTTSQAASAPMVRPEVRGKFLFVGDDKLWLKGVTYGTFAPDDRGRQFPAEEDVEADFAAMAAAGINAVRVYTIPPRSLLDRAERHGLRVMVGLPWEQHVAFLDRPGLTDEIVARLRRDIGGCIGHPAVLAFAVGNEIPAPVVRWQGRKRVEAFLARLAAMVRREDPGALVTYVNFPTTEYLELPFVDFVTFNVYLEDEAKLRAYLARLQNLADEKPLVMAEIGLDSRRNGAERQAEVLAWQISAAFEQGCAGTFVFAWTDRWYRGGHEIEDWDFGLLTRERLPKPALEAVRRAYMEAPVAKRAWPRISVVVCSYNGAATIGETLEGLARVEYPDFEVIVVNDGSTDATPEIAARYDVRLISTPNNGLSHARNLGMQAATGDVVAYTDDDAFPDPHWLTYLALAYEQTSHDAIGGPNLPPLNDNDAAQCVANAPGGPVHVLVSDHEAEHIPGCNMSFRRDKLMAIGGFDPQFRVAGDDVDVCWRIQEAGGTLGFHAAAMVWHHRRPSLARYLKQQQGYARAEALLARKWPSKYNGSGHLSWHGKLYGRGLMQALFVNQRLYQGQWGTAPFQSIYTPAAGLVASLPLMPEWYFLVVAMLLLGLLGLSWAPLFAFGIIGLAGLGISAGMAAKGAVAARFNGKRSAGELRGLKRKVFLLHLLQPAWRLWGRMRHGLGPWGLSRKRFSPVPVPKTFSFWSGTWRSTEERLEALRGALEKGGVATTSGGTFDGWDLAVRGSPFGSARCVAMVEEHGDRGQHFRLKAWPLFNPVALGAATLLVLLAIGAGAAGALVAPILLAVLAGTMLLVAYAGSATAMRAFAEAFARLER